MICFAAIVPHPVIAIPSLAKNSSGLLTNTHFAFKQIKQELYASKPDSLVIISPHVPGSSGALSVNQAKELIVSFKDFGDLTSYFTPKNNLGLSYALRERVETSVTLTATENQQLDHGCSVPLYHFLDRFSEVKLIIIGTASELDLASHYSAGQRFRKPLDTTNERVAILASADLSHEEKDAPSDGAAFDGKLVTWIETEDIRALLAVPADNPLVQGTCGLRPIVTLLGIMAEKKTPVQAVSFERVLGIGYYSAIFRLS